MFTRAINWLCVYYYSMLIRAIGFTGFHHRKISQFYALLFSKCQKKLSNNSRWPPRRNRNHSKMIKYTVSKFSSLFLHYYAFSLSETFSIQCWYRQHMVYSLHCQYHQTLTVIFRLHYTTSLILRNTAQTVTHSVLQNILAY